MASVSLAPVANAHGSVQNSAQLSRNRTGVSGFGVIGFGISCHSGSIIRHQSPFFGISQRMTGRRKRH